MGVLVRLPLASSRDPVNAHRIVTIAVGFGLCLLFFFVPETFWDRTPRPRSRASTTRRSLTNIVHHPFHPSRANVPYTPPPDPAAIEAALEKAMTPRQQKLHEQNAHARFEDAFDEFDARRSEEILSPPPAVVSGRDAARQRVPQQVDGPNDVVKSRTPAKSDIPSTLATASRKKPRPTGLSLPPLPDLSSPSVPGNGPAWGQTEPGSISQTEIEQSVPHLHNLNSPYYMEIEKNADYLGHHTSPVPQSDGRQENGSALPQQPSLTPIRSSNHSTVDLEKSRSTDDTGSSSNVIRYTTKLSQSPPKPYLATLRPWNGRLSKSNWFRVALRPFILFAYPSVLWSTLVYSLSVGWLIVLSEAISDIYRARDSYNFSALGAGLVYLSPFIGGILGTAIAGKVSDIVVRYMARRNGGIYEPEFRLVMGIPMTLTTVIGLMGFGWSAEERDKWIVPTIFFGIISFGCSLGSTTAITFCVDSYRQYAGEALVTLNFSKNIFHGLVFSLFFAHWLESDGPKSTFLAIGGIQIACLLTTIPMYIYGKRARMWTVRQAFMENF